MSELVVAQDKKTHLPNPIGLIEKAWEWRWAVRITYAVLFADLTLLFSGQPGILHFALTTQFLSSRFGALCVVVCVFGLFVSLGLPLVASFLRQLIYVGINHIPRPAWMTTERNYEGPRGCVLMGHFRDEMLATQSDFLKDIYDQEEKKRNEAEQNDEQLGVLIFGLLVLALTDEFAAFLGMSGDSLIATVLTTYGEWINGVWWTLLIGTFWLLCSVWFSGWKTRWVYYPPLYKRIEAKRLAEKQASREFNANWSRPDDD